jgi:hypothetical protein
LSVYVPVQLQPGPLLLYGSDVVTVEVSLSDTVFFALPDETLHPAGRLHVYWVELLNEFPSVPVLPSVAGYDQLAPPLAESLPERLDRPVVFVIVSVEETVWLHAPSPAGLTTGALTLTVYV